MELLNELNDKQLEAVTCTEGPSLVIAGAGSGKTKVLTHKIAYLISEKGVKPWNILAITFTNKAANEMKERVRNLVGEKADEIWMGTFHSICVRILRKTIERLGFDSSFVIFDTSDQKSMIKKILKEQNLDDKIYSDKSVLYEIGRAKNEMLTPEKYQEKVSGDFRKEKIATVFDIYQKRLKENNAVDFDDIINFTIEILLNNPDILEYYSERFQYVLVDEYQDTNKAQFTLVTLLASKYGNITVVGDNDQGIYSFRGADISNILNFEKDFPGTKIIKLEQNYRCTQNVLNVANEIIKNNETKYEKKLWTSNETGTKPMVYRGDNEYEEANYIVQEINRLRREEYYKYADFAVLYRMNTQSRSVEDILRRENIPYKVVGGLKFYERKEIKDIIAYLRLIHNPTDNLSLTRIINEPKRGVGKTSLDKVEQLAIENGISMYEMIQRADEFGLNRVFNNTREFVNTMEELRKDKDTKLVSELIKETLKKTGYTQALKEEDTLEAENRIENLDEFLTVAMEFEEQSADNSLTEFLEGITLSSDLDSVEEQEDSITLMTLHSAKGLEFPAVFLIGMEDGIFPSYQSIAEPKNLEEERRLCYVGITRAKEKLFMTCSKQRTVFGSTSFNAVSRFLKEISPNLVEGYENLEGKSNNYYEDKKTEWSYGNSRNNPIFEPVMSAGNYESHEIPKRVAASTGFKTAESFLESLSRPKSNQKIDFNAYQSGVKVYHKKFGEGMINFVEAEGDDLKVDIQFEKSGHKRLMAKFAGLEIIE